MKKNFNRNKNGFISILFLFFISLITVLLFSYTYIFYIQRQQDQFKKYCYIELVKIQRQAVQQEKSLFKLNTLSSWFRTYIFLLKAQITAAIATQNFPLAAQLTNELNTILIRQKNLDLLQKNIIYTSNGSLKNELLLLKYNLQRSSFLEDNIWKSLINTDKKYDLKTSVSLAIQPDSISGIAPNYELNPHYKQLQTLSLLMQVRIKSKDQFKTVLNTDQNYELECKITFNKTEEQWILETSQDKS